MAPRCDRPAYAYTVKGGFRLCVECWESERYRPYIPTDGGTPIWRLSSDDGPPSSYGRCDAPTTTGKLSLFIHQE